MIEKLYTRAAFVPATLNAETRTIEVTWSTGARVKRYDWQQGIEYWEQLSMDPAHVRLDRLNNGAPVLANHDADDLNDVLGVVERAWIVDGEGRASVRFSERADVDPIFADVKSGILRNISAGYKYHKPLERQPEMIDGLPVYLATDWEPCEISLVPINADAEAQTRSGETYKQTSYLEVRKMPGPADENKQPDTVMPDEAAIRADAAKHERERVNQIRAFGKTARADDAVVADLIERGIPAPDARAVLIEKWAARVDGETSRSDTSVTVDARDKFVEAGVNALRARAGVEKMDGANELRGMRLTEIAKTCLERAGVSARGMAELEMVKRAFTQSTSDFPVLLENAMHKTLQAAYATAPDTWTRFCSIGSLSDFRPHIRYRQGSFGSIDAVSELGEFKNKSIPDGEKSTITATTKGNIINISRQTIINDDLGAFIGLSQMLGRAARRTIEIDVYALLASNPTLYDGIALFHASHGNLVDTGSGAAPTVLNVDAARVLLAKQLDIGGSDYLDLRPAVWLGGMALGATARIINDAQYDPDTANKLQRPNAVRGLFRDVVDTPRISGTEWYMFADPDVEPVIEVAFLNGDQEPFLDSMEGFGVDGMQWKVRLDYGVAAIDYRGAVKNAGA